jgi:sugar lactone lactonase YvrE
LKVDAAGKGALLYKTGELDVMALAVDAQGVVYAGTSPDGKVYRITPGGEARVFFEPKTKYIWSLAFDRQGRLYVGTGDKGVIYRVTPDGKGETFVNPTQTNITALRVDAAGNLIAGADPGGLVLRISPQGKMFTLFDAAQREIRDLALGPNGEIYALALSETAGGGASNTAPAASAPNAPAVVGGDESGVTITISDVQVLDAGAGASPPAPAGGAGGGSQAKAALYRLDANGAGDALWEAKETAAFAVALGADGQVLVGTGQKGRIYAIAADQKPLLLAQSTEAQTSCFVRAGAQLYAAASNLGKLFKLGNETEASGSYVSPVREAATGATWGRITWVGEGEIELQTRSGNTATPDATWSDWSAAVVNAEGETVKSPAARFLQWRATLKRAANKPAPRLREVTVSYLPRNVAPRITALNLLPVGVALQAIPQPQNDTGAEQAGLDPTMLGGVANIPPRRFFQRGALSLQWQAEDRNGDGLEYAVYY